jgi:hypothetical protein
MQPNQRNAALSLGGLVALFLGWRAWEWQSCRADCDGDCAEFARATNPFGGRNDLGLSLCQAGVELCQSRCRFP